MFYFYKLLRINNIGGIMMKEKIKDNVAQFLQGQRNIEKVLFTVFTMIICLVCMAAVNINIKNHSVFYE